MLVILFPSSSALASAYGIAVATTMIITTCLIYFVARDQWKWGIARLYGSIVVILIVDLAFFGANIMKVLHGGYIPLVFASIVLILMTTWWRGRKILWERLTDQVEPFDEFFKKLQTQDYARIPGTAVFLIRDLRITPPAMIYNLRHNKVLHEKVILLTVVSEEVPHLSKDATRVETRELGRGFYRWIVHQGFMEVLDVPWALEKYSENTLKIDADEVTFFLDRVIPIPTTLPGMALWRERLFAFMSQNSTRATKFYKIPAQQVIEIGFQVEI
jgi:KUP system potassium uptake protein